MSNDLNTPLFAVIDLETTGFNAAGHDRIIEIAIVRLNSKWEVVGEYNTLINPERDIGRTDIHGIRSSDVLAAPTFDQVAGDIGEFMTGAIIAGHQVRFDLRFLENEFKKLNHPWPPFPYVCTLELAHEKLLETPSRKLAACCEAAGIHLEAAHSALADARASAQLLTYFSKPKVAHECPKQKSIFGKLMEGIPQTNWCTKKRTGLRLSRKETRASDTQEFRYLARLIERTLGDDARNAREGEYLSALDRALKDNRIERAEAEALVGLALSCGMTRPEVLNAHRAYLDSLVSEALSDGVISSSELNELYSVCDILDLNCATVDEFLTIHPRPSTSLDEGFRGMSVCFTGELLGIHNEERITRETAWELSTEAGLHVATGITKKLDLLVVSDPHTQSTKARKARDYGVRIVHEPVFWKKIGAPVIYEIPIAVESRE